MNYNIKQKISPIISAAMIIILFTLLNFHIHKTITLIRLTADKEHILDNYLKIITSAIEEPLKTGSVQQAEKIISGISTLIASANIRVYLNSRMLFSAGPAAWEYSELNNIYKNIPSGCGIREKITNLTDKLQLNILLLYRKNEISLLWKNLTVSIILLFLLAAFIFKCFFKPLLLLNKVLSEAEIQDKYSLRLSENQPYFSKLFKSINHLMENIQFRKVERDSAEWELKFSKEKLARIIETIPQPIYWKDKDSVYLGVNHHFKNLFKLESIKDIIGKTDADLPWSQEDLNKIKLIDQENRSHKSFFTAEEEFSLNSKHSKWLEITQAPLLDKNNLFIGIIGIIRDISEQVVYKKEIEDINRDLEDLIEKRTSQLADAYKELESFSYSVSHDLRAPLRKIQGFSKALSEDASDRLTRDDYFFLEKIDSSCTKMFSLIESMIELAKVSAEGTVMEDCNLSEMIMEITDDLKKSAPNRLFRIIIEENIFLKCDQKLMRIAVTNILRNAFKFTRDQKTAEIKFRKNTLYDGSAIYEISDNGTGFDSAKAQTIFSPFCRLHPDKKYEGSGIGLATVKRIILRHKGKIWAESKEGKGSSFFFTIRQS